MDCSLNVGYKVYSFIKSNWNKRTNCSCFLESTFGGTVVWTRNSTGLFYFTFINRTFTYQKLYFLLTNGDTIGPGSFVGSRFNSDLFLKS
jgi:hypothetical protein